MSTDTSGPGSTVTGGPGQPLTGDQYRAAMEVLVDAFRIVQIVPVAELREYLDKVETLGPILDPTAYMRHGDNLLDQRDIIEAAASVQRRLDRIRERKDRRAAR